MIETPTDVVSVDTRTDEEREFDSFAREYSSLPEPVMEKDNPDALFANGWGRRGHFALLVAPSGVGKSVISTQLLVPWASGRPGLVGSAPLTPLRISIVQAEDDDTEMGEFRRDHRQGHLDEGWTMDEILSAERKVVDWSRYFRGKTGDAFLRGLEFALRRQPVDVVMLNPLQSYAGVDLNKNAELSDFLRSGVDPILAKYRVFMLCIHHTNKPNTDKSKGGAFGDDATAAYVGAGGAELTNYARSVTFIRRCTPKECGIENSFMLVGAKRGNRLGWKDADGKRTNKRIIAYSEKYIHWRIPSQEEIDAAAGGTARKATDEMAPLSPVEAAELIASVIREYWPKKGINNFCRAKLCSTVSREDFAAGWKHFTLNYRQYGVRAVMDGNNAYHYEPADGADGGPAGGDGEDE